jgi:hypothetical protein
MNTRHMTDDQYDEWSDARGDEPYEERPMGWVFCGECGGGGCPACGFSGEVLVVIEGEDDDDQSL